MPKLKPLLIKGNLGVPTEFTDFNCRIVGYSNALLETEKGNRCIAIRSVKYSTHVPSSKIRDDAPADPETRITILLQGGPWKQSMWLMDDKSDLQEFQLDKAGDFLLWQPGYMHNWQPLGNSTMLTISLFQPILAFNVEQEAQQAAP